MLLLFNFKNSPEYTHHFSANDAYLDEKEAKSKSRLLVTGFHHEALTYPGTVITIITPSLPAF